MFLVITPLQNENRKRVGANLFKWHLYIICVESINIYGQYMIELSVAETSM